MWCGVGDHQWETQNPTRRRSRFVRSPADSYTEVVTVILRSGDGTVSNLVGPKGQVVIEKEIRDRLGVKPGWKTVQTVVGNSVNVYFIPPEHNRSLYGCLREHVKTVYENVEEWAEAIE